MADEMENVKLFPAQPTPGGRVHDSSMFPSSVPDILFGTRYYRIGGPGACRK